MKTKRALLIGGTGALGRYLAPELRLRGFAVDVVSLDEVESSDPALRYFRRNLREYAAMSDFLAEMPRYDVIVDYMIYGTEEFRLRCPLLLDSTDRYVFLSTYRVYADEEHPVRESSPRLLEATRDETYRPLEEYGLFKAREEDILHASGRHNFTVLRPSITYSAFRFQLTTLEADVLIYRIRTGRTVILPEPAMEKQATMTYSRDSARLVAGLIENPATLGETYSVTTAEHHTWREIAELYRSLTGMRYITVDGDTYLRLLGGERAEALRYQLYYDRCFDRVMDNSRILAAAGMRQSDMTPLAVGLKAELDALPADWLPCNTEANARMDEYLTLHGID